MISSVNIYKITAELKARIHSCVMYRRYRNMQSIDGKHSIVLTKEIDDIFC